MKRLKLIADDKIPFLNGVLDEYVDVLYLPGAEISNADVKDADALFIRTRTKCNASLLDGSSVRLIATATIGYDHIDTEYCDRNGIKWVNAPGCNSGSVCQYITTAILDIGCRKYWNLRDMTLGIIGVGNVGSKVAEAAEGIGMRVLLNDPPREDAEGSEKFTPLNELLEQSDIVTCHTPLSRGGKYPTYHLANDDFFARMKKNALFINTSRGEVVDSEALRRAIGKLYGFILDVWENEPDVDPELRREAYMATPHIAGYSADGKANGTAACVQEFLKFFDCKFLSPDWYPKDIPLPSYIRTDSITLSAASKTLQFIAFELTQIIYEIHFDSELLKRFYTEFETIRGKYYTRREHAYFNITITETEQCNMDGVPGEPKEAMRYMLNKLGFKKISIN